MYKFRALIRYGYKLYKMNPAHFWHGQEWTMNTWCLSPADLMFRSVQVFSFTAEILHFCGFICPFVLPLRFGIHSIFGRPDIFCHWSCTVSLPARFPQTSKITKAKRTHKENPQVSHWCTFSPWLCSSKSVATHPLIFCPIARSPGPLECPPRPPNNIC